MVVQETVLDKKNPLKLSSFFLLLSNHSETHQGERKTHLNLRCRGNEESELKPEEVASYASLESLFSAPFDITNKLIKGSQAQVQTGSLTLASSLRERPPLEFLVMSYHKAA